MKVTRYFREQVLRKRILFESRVVRTDRKGAAGTRTSRTAGFDIGVQCQRWRAESCVW